MTKTEAKENKHQFLKPVLYLIFLLLNTYKLRQFILSSIFLCVPLSACLVAASEKTGVENATKPLPTNSITDKNRRHWQEHDCLQALSVYRGGWLFENELESKAVLMQARQENSTLKVIGGGKEKFIDYIIDNNSVIKGDLIRKKNEEERIKRIYTIKCYAGDAAVHDKERRKIIKKVMKNMKLSLDTLNKEIRDGKAELLPDKALKLLFIGQCYKDLGKKKKALELFTEAFQIYRRLYADKHDIEPMWFVNMIDEYARNVRFYGKPEDAIALYEEAIEILTKLKEENADVKDIELALKNQKLGEVYYCCKGLDKQKAVPYFQNALRIYEKEKLTFAIEEMESALGSLQNEGFQGFN